MCEFVCCRRMVSQAAMRGQRVVESEYRCWNLAVWLLVSLLGSLVLVAVSVLLRLGECLWVGIGGFRVVAAGLDLLKFYNRSRLLPACLPDCRSSLSALQNTICD